MDTITEIEAKQRMERRQIREDAELFEQLLKHKAWPRYVSLVEAVAQNYHATIMKPLTHALECTQTEFAKGALSGLSLATSLPAMKIKESHELRRKAEEEE